MRGGPAGAAPGQCDTSAQRGQAPGLSRRSPPAPPRAARTRPFTVRTPPAASVRHGRPSSQGMRVPGPLVSRRTFLRGTVAVGAMAATTGVWARPASAEAGPVRVYVIVVDGLRPDEVTRMPMLAQLAREGTYYPASRALMVAETTTNHLSMLTGTRPDRHGMPGNSVPRLSQRVSDDRRYVKGDSLLTLAARQAPELRTATIGSKTYVAELAKHDRTGDGDQDVTRSNTPLTALPVIDAALDEETGTEARLISQQLDPDFLFLNLGMVDRVGHVDITGGVISQLPVLRQVALQQADLQLRLLVDELKRSGRWDSTVFMVTADHSMDWSRLDRGLNLAPAFEADPLLAGEVVAADNGGACLYALRAPDDPLADARLARMRELALAVEGVEEALYLRPNPADGGEQHGVGSVHPTWKLGELGGELIVTCAPGFRIGHSTSLPDQFANPIPGNHGHPTTLPIPIVVAGGWSGIVRQRVDAEGDLDPSTELPTQATNLDLAPTAAWLLGLSPPPGGFDGRVLSEAFTARPSPRVAIQRVVSVPTLERVGSDDPVATAAELARAVVPAGSAEVVLVDADDTIAAAIAAPFAIVRRAPLLLTPADALAPQVAAELDRLEPGRVIVVGRTITDAVLDAVRADGVETVDRLAGDDHAGTAAAVARTLGVDGGDRRVVLLPTDPDLLGPTAAVVAAANHPAAPSSAGSPTGGAGLFGRRPVLLAGRDALPPATAEVIAELDVRRVTVAAGHGDVGDAVLTALRATVPIVERIGGDGAGGDLAAAAARTASRGTAEGALTDDLYLVVPGAAGASAAVWAGIHGGTVLPLTAAALDGATGDWLRERADEFVHVRAVGGPDAIPDALLEQVADLLRDQRTRGTSAAPPAAGGTDTPPPGPDPDDGTTDEATDAPRLVGGGPTSPSRPLPVTGAGLAPALGAAAVLGAWTLRRHRRVPEDGGPPAAP
ncbi:hypothetical protein FTX61_00640 [Nitriliruptoraceae bacterium ZYF776]|nr:hypothetical protein [Profundirhabdus halotolerans]